MLNVLDIVNARCCLLLSVSPSAHCTRQTEITEGR